MAGREEKSRDIMVAQSGYNIYSDVSSSTGNQNIPAQFMSHLPAQQSFDPTTSTPAAEIYNLTAGMEMIGFPSKHHHHHHQHTTENPGFWKGFFSSATKPTGNNNNNGGGGGLSSSSSKEITDDPTSADNFYQHQQNYSDAIQNQTPPSSSSWNNIHHNHHQNRFLSSDDGGGGGGGGAVFPCEGNERPSQGLSLSLSSSNPSTIQLQSFQLIRQQHQQQNQNQHVINMQSDVLMHHHQHVIDNHNHQSHAVITNSKYLLPTQELLYEFCSLETNEIDHKSKPPKSTDSSLVDETAIKTLDLLELQRRKTKLLQMLEEVDRRYKQYCDQMKAVISSFESTAGNGSARVYSSLASRAMSRHFRCLRDGIVSQIKAAKKAMGDKDVSAPGSVKGETPRLRVLDQTLRQQRAMQQMSLMESHPWRPQRGLPERSVSVLRAWLFEHFLHPYPSDVDKHILARQTGLSRSQVSNWFINARVRLWKPMVEEMYLEELKEDEGIAGDGGDGGGGGGGGAANVYESDGLMSSQNHSRSEDLKPTHDQLVRMDSECLSSIINNNKNEAKRNKGGGGAAVQNEQHHQINPSFGRVIGDSYGSAAMELDFSSYSHHSSGGGSAVHYGGVGGGGGGVSLTLGLHQHGGGGVGLGTQNSLFYGGRSEHMVEDNQYSLLDGGENQNLPYRNLMGAQLLHDLAG